MAYVDLAKRSASEKDSGAEPFAGIVEMRSLVPGALLLRSAYCLAVSLPDTGPIADCLSGYAEVAQAGISRSGLLAAAAALPHLTSEATSADSSRS